MPHASCRLLPASPAPLLLRHFSTISPPPPNLLLLDANHIHLEALLRRSTALHHCKQIHARLILLPASPHSTFLAARLLSIYSTFHLLADAHTVFHTALTHQPSNLLLWNSMLRATLSHGQSKKAFSLYLQMRKLCIGADSFTFPLVLRACSALGDLKLCLLVHNHVFLLGFQFHLHVANELIGMYSKFEQMDYARKVFDVMPYRSVISWNVLVSGFSMNRDCISAMKMFKRMEAEGLEANPITWTSLLSAHARCGQLDKVMELFSELRMRGTSATAESIAVVLSVCSELGAPDKGKAIHGYTVRIGFGDYPFVRNSLMCMYGKTGNWVDTKRVFSEIEVKSLVSWNTLISCYAGAGLCDEALDAFQELAKVAKESDISPNVISWSALIGGFASNGRKDKSLELFHQMLYVGVRPNSVTMATILSVCAELPALGLGREIHGYVVRSLMDGNILVENGLIHMYMKGGSLEDARKLFDRMDSRDLISWNSMIAGYGMHGLGHDAVSTFRDMVRTGLRPDGITFVALLSACSHSGLVDEGREVFKQMLDVFTVVPQMEHYCCMVDLLGRAGLLQEANDLVKRMPMKPNAFVWGALLNSCRIHRNMTVAEEIASEIFSLNMEITGSYMLLSNIYAVGGRWEDSARVRVFAKTKGLKKNPGQSWIEVKKKVYLFSASNALQWGMEGVNALLEDLCLQMEAKGYIPDKSYVLQDVDEEEKRQILYGHSEKLAIAFGHANVPTRMPIRVMKNLRVCGDCHNWTKFFTKVTSRRVIVRDGHRFHHFANGSCSCNDYW